MEESEYQKALRHVFENTQAVDNRLIRERESIHHENINLWFWNGVLCGALAMWGVVAICGHFFGGGVK